MKTKTPETPEKSSGSVMTAGLFGLACAFAGCSIIYIFKSQFLPPFVHIEEPKTWNFEAQMRIFIKFAFFNGLIIFINSIIIAQARVFQWKVEPQQGGDTQLITILNNILRNSIEQAIPFLLIYLYWLVYKAQAEDIRLAYCFGFYFVLYRLIFFVGYIAALVIKTSILRGVGFGGAGLTTILLITKSLGLNLI